MRLLAGGAGAPDLPGADDPERAALPLHLRPSAAALFDRLPSRQPGDVADTAMAALEEAGRRLEAHVPPGAQVLVDAYRVRLAAGCPASASGGDEGFRWTAATAARALGLRALALHLRGTAQPIEEAAGAVIAELVADRRERTPGPWLAGLDPAARAVARAQAQRWAEQAASWLPLRLVDPQDLRFLDDDWWPGGRRPGRTLVLHGRRDLTVEVGGVRVAITVAGGSARSPGMAEADAVTALAATLCDPRGRLVRVVRVHPASGEVVAADITAPLLERGVAAAVATAAAVAAGSPVEVPTRPGPGCTWCSRQAACSPGTAWLGRAERRSMGLPLAG